MGPSRLLERNRVPAAVSRNEARLFSVMVEKKYFNAAGSGSVVSKGQWGSVTMTQKSHP